MSFTSLAAGLCIMLVAVEAQRSRPVKRRVLAKLPAITERTSRAARREIA